MSEQQPSQISTLAQKLAGVVFRRSDDGQGQTEGHGHYMALPSGDSKEAAEKLRFRDHSKKWMAGFAFITVGLPTVFAGVAVGKFNQQSELTSSLGGAAQARVQNFQVLDAEWHETAHDVAKDGYGEAKAILKDNRECSFNYQTRPHIDNSLFGRVVLDKLNLDIYDTLAAVVPNADDKNMSGTCELLPPPKKK